jgi:hypothetical protein
VRRNHWSKYRVYYSLKPGHKSGSGMLPMSEGQRKHAAIAPDPSGACFIAQCHLLCREQTVCINCGAANPGCSRLSAGSFGTRTLADGPKSRLKRGCGQDCPPHNLCRIAPGRKVSGIGLSAHRARTRVDPSAEPLWRSLSCPQAWAGLSPSRDCQATYPDVSGECPRHIIQPGEERKWGRPISIAGKPELDVL